MTVVFPMFFEGLQLYPLATLSIFTLWAAKLAFQVKINSVLLMSVLRDTDWNHNFKRRGMLSLH